MSNRDDTPITLGGGAFRHRVEGMDEMVTAIRELASAVRVLGRTAHDLAESLKEDEEIHCDAPQPFPCPYPATKRPWSVGMGAEPWLCAIHGRLLCQSAGMSEQETETCVRSQQKAQGGFKSR